ncbi:hypothetical protein TNCV_2523411 [Trichonephila clavipes]|nr:hypothetical protein TNCV_2523411 [Trichonephila clavipes]
MSYSMMDVFKGHVNTHNACTWSLENPHEVLKLQRDSPKLNGFVTYLGGKSDLPDLRHMIEAAVVSITSDTLNKAWDELAYRLDLCCVMNGAHIEHL